ncbi:MAG: LexA family protein [Bacillota bacterium]
MFNKLKLGQLIEKALDNRSTIQYAKDSNVNRTYISKIINEKLNNAPSPEILAKLAKNSRGHVSYQELMSAAGYLNGIELSEFSNNSNLAKVPIVQSLADDTFKPSNINDYKIINEQDLNLSNPFFFKATDDSMVKTGINSGSLVLIEKTAQVQNQDIVAVNVNSKDLIRTIYFENKNIILLAAHSNYAPLIIPKLNINIIGKCIRSISKLP